MAASSPSRSLLAVAAVVSTVAFIGLAVLGWGDARSFFAHPARLGATLVSVAATLAAVASPVTMSRGVRDDPADRRIFAPLVLGSLVLAWLPPWADRHGILTFDGDAVRWLGLALLAAGSVLRIWPIFVLGHRFSGFVAIQPGHELVTTGLYAVIRNPSYLGAVLVFFGWALLFRSGLGLLLGLPGGLLLVQRMDAEERLLESHFGDAYRAYRARTWRLVPGLY
jgi:protein-S-isoprenylcysteine O-methyltransferase Ste14